MKALLLIVPLLFTQALAAGLSNSRPNIIVVMTDDQGYGDLSCHGHPYIKTPHIDQLREESLRLEDFHASSSCAPTRAAFMSGVHPFKVGVTHTIFHRELMALDKTTIAEVMRDAGYATGLFGKWHLGDTDPYQPHRRGFTESLIHGGGIAGSSGIRSNGSYNDLLIRHNGKFVQTQGFCTDMFFAHSLKWVKEQADANTPFFLCLLPNAPHGPFNAPAESLALYQDIEDPAHKDKAGFFGLISNIDDNMGLLMRKLDEWNLSENTIVIFTTDNGSVASSVYNADMKGGKTSMHRGGSRVPFFIKWPGKIPTGKNLYALTRHVDLFPTFCELAGADTSELELDGKSLLPLLEDSSTPWPNRTEFFHKGRWGNPESKHEKHRRNPGADNNKYHNFSVRSRNWKLVIPHELNRGVELYQITDDPEQLSDLSAKHPDVIKSLIAEYSAWWDGVRPYMINEDADIKAPTVKWTQYLKEQIEKEGPVPVLETPSL